MNKLRPNPDAPEVLIGPVRFPGDGGIGRVVSRGGRIVCESWTRSGWIEGGFEMVELAQSRTATPDELTTAGIPAEAPKPELPPERFEDGITEGMAEEVCHRIAEQTQLQLQSMPQQCRLSGDDSILKDFWEELCVQMQSGEESFQWSLYEDNVRTIVTGQVAKLPEHEAQAVWELTDDALGCCGDFECLEREWANSAWDDAIVDYIINEHVYPAADRFKNERTRAYLDRSEH